MTFPCGYCDTKYDVTDLLWYSCCGCYLCADCQKFHLDNHGDGNDSSN